MEHAQRILVRICSKRQSPIEPEPRTCLGSMRGWRKPETNVSSRASRLDHDLVRALTPSQGDSLGLVISRPLKLRGK